MKTPFVIAMVVALHIVAFGALFLMQGCGKTAEPMLSSQGELPPPRAVEIIPPTAPADVPAAAAAAAVEWPSETKIYTVKKGDMLSKIASRYNVKMSEILRLNGLTDPNRLRVGQSLVLPGYVKLDGSVSPAPALAPAAAPAVAPVAPVAPVASGGTYTIKPGDSLSRIASRHGTSVAVLKRLNGMSSDKIFAGKTLKLPGAGSSSAAADQRPPVVDAPAVSAPAVAPVAPVVDSVPSLPPADAPSAPASPDAGEAPIAPSLVPDLSDVPVTDSAPELAGQATVHVVKEGESLISVAKRYNVLVADLIAVNKRVDSELSGGQELVIPMDN